MDATIALEFLPQDRRHLVALMGMWQPIGVVASTALAYGTVAQFKCPVRLPACNAEGLEPGAECCTIASNMGWRYLVLTIGSMTLVMFFARYFVFRFYESPKFLLSKGREQDAIDVLHKIAKFNGATAPTLTVQDFQAIDRATGKQQVQNLEKKSTKERAAAIIKSLSFLGGLFQRKIQCFIFGLMAIAYMVSTQEYSVHQKRANIILERVIIGHSPLQDTSCQLYCSETTWTAAQTM